MSVCPSRADASTQNDTNRHERPPTWSRTKPCTKRAQMQAFPDASSTGIEQGARWSAAGLRTGRVLAGPQNTGERRRNDRLGHHLLVELVRRTSHKPRGVPLGGGSTATQDLTQMAELPRGTVTFLFTGNEGSRDTPLLAAGPDACQPTASAP